jgi:DNA-binding MarR family transcriptional regulator
MASETPLTELILQSFRLHGRLLAAGDALVADLGLTSARWQVLGAVSMSPLPLPVAHIARNMGLARQSVQRIVSELVSEGVLRLERNPHHARAQLVVPTERGAAVYEAARARQGPWAAALSKGLAGHDIPAATALLRALEARLEEVQGNGSASKGGEAC